VGLEVDAMADKFRTQGKLEADGENLEEGRAYSKRLQEMSRAVVSGLYMLVKNVKLYDPDNAIFVKPLESFRESINLLIRAEGNLNLQAAGEAFYLNNMLVRTDIKSADNIRYLVSEFERVDMGGFELDAPINVSEIKALLQVFRVGEKRRGGGEDVSDRKLQVIRLRKFEKLKEIMSSEKALDASSSDGRLDRKRYGMLVFSRLIFFMRRFIEGQRGDGPPVHMNKALRFIQDMVDVCHGHRANFLGLSVMDRGEEALVFHAVNVAVLSIVFGSEVGIGKERLRDLGMAGLFHDLGKMALDPDLLLPNASLNPEQEKRIEESSLRSVVSYLRAGAMDKRSLVGLLVAANHGTDYGVAVENHLGKISHIKATSSLCVYSKIVGIADAYDTLTCEKAYSADIAVSLMNSDLAHRFDPILLRAFGQMMKFQASKVFVGAGERLELF